MRRCGRRPSLRRDERGQILALFAGSLAALLMVAAFTIDAGYAWWAKRALQGGADAAALAGARDLSNPSNARAMALLYSGNEATAGAKNKAVPGTVATVCVPGDACGVPNKVIVTQAANVKTFFWRVLGRDDYDVSARAVATYSVVTNSGPPLAIYADESCSGTGLKVGSANIWIEGSVHSNGDIETGGSGFRTGKATYWRPTSGNSGCVTSGNGAKFNCAPSAITNCATWDPLPTSEATRRTWPTKPAITEATLRGSGNVNCHPGTPPSSLTPSNIGTGRTYCYGNTDVNLSGTFTAGTTVTIVTSGGITMNGSGTLKAARDNVLFFRENSSQKEIILNPGPGFTFEGYIINRGWSVKVNQSNVTTPSNGYLEATWLDLNGEGFKMYGLLPDPSTSTANVQVNLEE